MAVVTESNWHGFPALALESERMRAVFVPRLGAKIVSLFDKARRREWLVAPMRAPREAGYAASFVAQDMSGWDEMMPTINACRCQGVDLPDHGEVWGIPWQVAQHGETLLMGVDGVALPYRFTRTAALVSPGCLELRYSLSNSGDTAFPYLWAAHPQFAANADTRILLPPEVTQVVNVIGDDPAWGKEGHRVDWPQARAVDGRLWQLDRVRGVDARACRKFYVPPEQPARWAGLMDEHLVCLLRLEWQPDETPYLGLWVDEGTHNAVPVAALEPASGFFDSLDWAVDNRRVTTIQPGEEKHWTLRIRLGDR